VTLQPTDIPLEEQLEEAYRALRQNKRMYPEWIRRGTLSDALAARRLASQEAICATLKAAWHAEQDARQLAMFPPETP
jgi:hypothetical protein